MAKTLSDILKQIHECLADSELLEGMNPTPIPFLTLYRHTEPTVTMPQAESYLYIVLDGAIRLYTPHGIMDYLAGQYSVSEIDTPLSGHVLTFSEYNDFLSVAVACSANDVLSVVLDIEGDLAEQIATNTLSESTKTTCDVNVLHTACRLIAIRNDPVECAYIAQTLRQEMIFYTLCGSCGTSFLESIIGIGQAGDIYAVNRWIKQHFRSPFTVESLAKQKHMSVSQLHDKFKRAIGMGPLQCQKRLRLTEARRLMFDENKNVTEAAMDVGYESVSQFTRDYRRVFGFSPKEDVLRLTMRLEHPTKFQED